MGCPRLALLAPLLALPPMFAAEPPGVHDVPPAGLTVPGAIRAGDPPLADAPIRNAKGAPHQVVRVALRKGQSYVIYLLSERFDAFLILHDSAGQTLAFDDNSGGGQNARIVHVPTADGEFRLLLVSLDKQPGAFQVKVRPGGLTEDETLADEATKLNREGFQLYQRGQAAAAAARVRAALEIRRKLYPASKYPDGHPDLAVSLNNLGVVLRVMGQAEQALPHFRDALAMRRKLYPAATYPDGHPDLALSLNNLGGVLQAMGQAEQALPYCRDALAMRTKLYPAARYPAGHPDLTRSLDYLAAVLKAMGQAEQALPNYRDALAMRRKLYPAATYPDGHPDLARNLHNLGSVLEAMGQAEQALPHYRDALAMTRTLYPADKYPAGHPDLATGLNNLGFVMAAMGQAEQALPYCRDALAMRRRLYPAATYPDGHPDLATSLNNLGYVLEAMGQAEQALPHYRDALTMRRKLYPASHPDLANSLNNLGGVLLAMGQAEQALPHYRDALAMKQKLYPAATYPAGHPDLALSLHNLGGVLLTTDRAEQALPYYRDALAMTRTLYPADKYPAGHPDLANSLNNLGGVLKAMDQAEQALPHFRDALAMYRKLYPTDKYPAGHQDLASSLSNLGGVLLATGRAEQALPHVRDALAMQQRLLRRELATASEEAAFDKIEAEPLHRDAYLSVTSAVKAPAGDVVRDLWPSRAMVTRLLEQRQANARAAGTELGDQLDKLRGLRRRLDRLLQDSRMKPEDRDQQLVAVTQERDALERAVVGRMPTLKHWQELDRLGPADLANALPPGTAFIDVTRYTHFEYVDQKQKSTPRYVAFVLAKDRPVQRAELGDAAVIDAAVRQWRAAIDARDRTNTAAATLGRLVWEPVAKQLPPDTQALYLAPDGDLARLPWAALPVADGRVLLEDYAIAQVPHGTFLLAQLKFGRRFEGAGSLLAVGGVDYGAGRWPALPGTAAEVQAVTTLAPGDRAAAGGKDATAAWVTQRLPAARCAHLATHGEFRAAELTADRVRAAQALTSPRLGGDARRVAAKNPLGYVGLVLANGEVLSGLGIVDLPLQNTQLVTLSACETGLGELTGGEGVQGLQRAFHLAGCPNVVASLWRVDDAATAALMAKFYHELWVNKKPPIAALREAQLTIYRRPELIPDLAGERGAPRLKDAVALKPAAPAGEAPGASRAATKVWAAFVLSGVGR